MEAFFISTGVVALGEMDDKTQLLAMLLAAKFRKPVPSSCILGHTGQPRIGWCRGRLGLQSFGPDVLRWVIGISFIAMAVWMLVPDN